MTKGSFAVYVTKDYLKFSAAHFMAEGAYRERLHGHNYRVSVRLEGLLGKDGYVIDFSLVKELGRKLCQELDERTLIPMRSSCLEIRELGAEVEVTYGDGSRFVFPSADVILLPLAHTSAEELAQFLAQRLSEKLAAQSGRGLAWLEVGVDESRGQTAFCRLSLEQKGPGQRLTSA